MGGGRLAAVGADAAVTAGASGGEALSLSKSLSLVHVLALADHGGRHQEVTDQ